MMEVKRNCAVFLAIFVSILANTWTSPTPKKKTLSPVVLVPGDGGSQFEAVLDKPKVVHIWCEKKTDKWFPLWLNLELLVPYVLDCFVDNMKLSYDRSKRITINQPGVTTRQPNFGNTSSVEWLDSSQLGPTSYFYHVVETLVASGYERDVNIRGAPYDFRKAPNENQKFVSDLKKLIEDTYEANNNQKVILIGHSMGNPYVLYLLSKQNQGWKNKYIRTFISLAGPWGGAVKTLRLMASGDNLGVFVVNPLTVREEQRSMPSTAWLMPQASFWKDNEVLISAPGRNYTINDFKAFFDDINFEDGYYMWQDTMNLIKDLPHPGVETHCLHGVNVSTPFQLKYTNKTWHDDPPEVVNGNGDGTVNLRSLYGCKRWMDKKPQVYHKEFPGVEHVYMLQDQGILDYIKMVVNS